MLEILFLLGFSLHNLEEGLWLPAWSRHAGRFHRSVDAASFRFALILVTSLGYLITAVHLWAGIHPMVGEQTISYLFHGFVAMMIGNVLFPHVLATIVLRRYAPGLLTGVMLILPVGAMILYRGLRIGETGPMGQMIGALEWPWLLAAGAGVTVMTLGLIALSLRYARILLQGLE